MDMIDDRATIRPSARLFATAMDNGIEIKKQPSDKIPFSKKERCEPCPAAASWPCYDLRLEVTTEANTLNQNPIVTLKNYGLSASYAPVIIEMELILRHGVMPKKRISAKISDTSDLDPKSYRRKFLKVIGKVKRLRFG